MKVKELNALKTKRAQLNVFDSYRAVAECLFAQHLAINNGYVFGPEQYRQWLLYRMYMNRVAVVVSNMKIYYCDRIIAAMDKQIANNEKRAYYRVKMATHLKHYLKLDVYEEKQAYHEKMIPLMITYRGSDFAEAFYIEASVRNFIMQNADVLICDGITYVEVNDFARLCLLCNFEDFEVVKDIMGEAGYKKAVKQLYKVLMNCAGKINGKAVLKLQ